VELHSKELSQLVVLKEQFKPLDKPPALSMCDRVYVKLDAPDALLLPENVCCELDIVTYHPNVQTVLPAMEQSKPKGKNKKARITPIQTVRLPAGSSPLVEVEVRESMDTT